MSESTAEPDPSADAETEAETVADTGTEPGPDAESESEGDAVGEPELDAQSESDATTEAGDQAAEPEPLQADGEPVDHEPLVRAEQAIDEAKAAAGRVEQSGGTFGGDVTEDVSAPGAGDDRGTGVESAPEGSSDTH